QDLYLRVIDRAKLMKYSAVRVSRHNVPDQRVKSNMSTAVTTFEKRLFQLRVHDKIILFGQTPAVRESSQRHKIYTLKMIAEELVQLGKYEVALYYAKEALFIGFSIKWLAFCVLIRMKKSFAPKPS